MRVQSPCGSTALWTAVPLAPSLGPRSPVAAPPHCLGSWAPTPGSEASLKWASGGKSSSSGWPSPPVLAPAQLSSLPPPSRALWDPAWLQQEAGPALIAKGGFYGNKLWHLLDSGNVCDTPAPSSTVGGGAQMPRGQRHASSLEGAVVLGPAWAAWTCHTAQGHSIQPQPRQFTAHGHLCLLQRAGFGNQMLRAKGTSRSFDLTAVNGKN